MPSSKSLALKAKILDWLHKDPGPRLSSSLSGWTSKFSHDTPVFLLKRHSITILKRMFDMEGWEYRIVCYLIFDMLCN
jgi:hypothetical protein